MLGYSSLRITINTQLLQSESWSILPIRIANQNFNCITLLVTSNKAFRQINKTELKLSKLLQYISPCCYLWLDAFKDQAKTLLLWPRGAEKNRVTSQASQCPIREELLLARTAVKPGFQEWSTLPLFLPRLQNKHFYLMKASKGP